MKVKGGAEVSAGIDTVQTFAECLAAIGNKKRLEIVQYCLEPHTFTEIVLNLKLNPASFKFHSTILIDCGVIKKVERGTYVTTDLGKLLLRLVNQAAEIAKKTDAKI